MNRRVAIACAVVLLAVAWAGWRLLAPPVREPPPQFAGAFGADVLDRPVGVAVHEGRVYVTDTDRHRMVVFDARGALLGTSGDGSPGREAGRFRRPMHLTWGPDERLYVTDMNNHRVQVFTGRGMWLDSISALREDAEDLHLPSGVAVTPDGSLYVVEFERHRVRRLAADGTLLDTWEGVRGVRGLSRAGFHFPTDIAVAPDGTWYVADGFNHRVKQYDVEGNLTWIRGGLFGLGIPGPFRGWFSGAHGLGLSPDGTRIYVADFFNHRVQVFDAEGRFRTTFGDPGDGPGQMTRPTDVAMMNDAIYVVDHGNDRLQIWRAGEGGTP